MKSLARSVLVLTLVLALAAVAQAAGPSKSECALAGIKTPAQLDTFLTKLREAVTAGDKAAVAALVDYPLQVIRASEDITIESKEDFIKQYDDVMTPKVKEAAMTQKLDGIFINKQGVMMTDVGGDDRLRLMGDGKNVLITRITN